MIDTWRNIHSVSTNPQPQIDSQCEYEPIPESFGGYIGKLGACRKFQTIARRLGNKLKIIINSYFLYYTDSQMPTSQKYEIASAKLRLDQTNQRTCE